MVQDPGSGESGTWKSPMVFPSHRGPGLHGGLRQGWEGCLKGPGLPPVLLSWGSAHNMWILHRGSSSSPTSSSASQGGSGVRGGVVLLERRACGGSPVLSSRAPARCWPWGERADSDICSEAFNSLRAPLRKTVPPLPSSEAVGRFEDRCCPGLGGWWFQGSGSFRNCLCLTSQS